MSKREKLVIQRSFLERLIKWGIVAVFTVLPLLYFPGRIASYVTSKEYFFIGSVDVLVVLWVWLLLVDKRYRLIKKNLLYLSPFFLFLASMTVSAFVGADTATSFFSTVESGTGLVLLYHAFAFTCIITSLIRVQQKKLLTNILQANLFASAVLAGFTYFTNKGFRIASVMLDGSSGGAMMGNSLLVGAYFIFSIFLTIMLIGEEKHVGKKILYWLSIGLMALSPIFFNVNILKGAPISQAISSGYYFFGEARIAGVSLIIGLVSSLFIWLSLQKNKKITRAIGIAGIVAGVLIAIIVAVQLATPSTALAQFFAREGGNRSVDWKASVQGIQEKPLLGWGPENFRVVYQKYLDPVVFDPGRGNEVWAMHPHNNSLEILVNGGVIGFAMYVLIFVALFIGISRLYRKGVFDSKSTALVVGMLIAFILQQQMIYESIVSYVMLFLMVGVVAGLSATTNDQRHFKYTDRADYLLAGVVAVVVFPVWLYGAYYPARKMEEFQTISTLPSDQRTSQYQHLFHSSGAYTIKTDAEFYTDPLFFSYDPQKDVLKENPVYQKVASNELTALMKAVDPINTQRPAAYHLALSLVQLQNLRFYLTGDTALLDAADQYAQKAFKLSPSDPQIYYFYSQTLVYEGNIEGAKKLLDRAIDLNPHYLSAVQYRKALQ